jgi:hypothetical protein
MSNSKKSEYVELPSTAPGASQILRFVHYGNQQARPKIYLQAALHADEIPGLLVMRELEKMLDDADAAGHIQGHIILAPVANPVGLGQFNFGVLQGRYNLVDGINFNRDYTDLYPQLLVWLEAKLGPDDDQNLNLIRSGCREILAKEAPLTVVGSMRHALLSRAIDADYVFDIHCDDEAVMHIYTTPSAWPDLRDLVDYLECPLVLLAQISGGNPFDEACSSLWSSLADAFPDHPIPTGCVATTIELRGQADVSEKLACQDATALYSFMIKRGILAGDAPDVSQAEVAVHPLEGLARIEAPCTGVVTLQIQPGQWVESGEILATVYPLEEDALPVNIESPIAGLAFSRRIGRYVQAGLKIAKVSGAKAMPVKPGQTLLSD